MPARWTVCRNQCMTRCLPGGRYVAINGQPSDWARAMLDVLASRAGISVQRTGYRLGLELGTKDWVPIRVRAGDQMKPKGYENGSRSFCVVSLGTVMPQLRTYGEPRTRFHTLAEPCVLPSPTLGLIHAGRAHKPLWGLAHKPLLSWSPNRHQITQPILPKNTVNLTPPILFSPYLSIATIC